MTELYLKIKSYLLLSVAALLTLCSAAAATAGMKRAEPSKPAAAASSDVRKLPEIKELLQSLDSLLQHTPRFIEEKEQRLAKLRDKYNQATDIERRYWLASDLYDEYCAYDSDSAMLYIDRAQNFARMLGRQDLVNEMELNRAYIYSATGLLNEADRSLEKIDPADLPPMLALKYCDRVVFLSTHRDQYIGVVRDTEAYSQMVDSLLKATAPYIKPDSPNYCWLTGWSNLNSKENARKAIPEVEKIVSATDFSTRGNAMDAWVLSKLYERTGNEDMRLRYLLLSAMADVRACNKEIASLEEIAAIMLANGDLEHANSYINYCIAYANDYKSRVRLGQLAKVQEQTLTAIQKRHERQAYLNRIYLIILCVFLAVMIGLIFYIGRQNRLLRLSRETLHDSNVELSRRVEELQSTREELNKTNAKLAEMYESARSDARGLSEDNSSKANSIAKLFGIYSDYMSRQEEFRTKLYRLLKERKFEDAMRILKSPELTNDEIKEFHAIFDEVFLNLYPDFVDQFNTLLREEERIELRNPKKLTSELRIYALVHLGLNDSVKIARLLHCSVQTVYNTRQRTRNKAAVAKEEFADHVRALGRPDFLAQGGEQQN